MASAIVKVVEVGNLDETHRKLARTEPADMGERAEEYEEVLAELELLVIANHEDYDFVTDQLINIKRMYKEIEKRRKAAVNPGNEEKKVIQGWYKPPLLFLEECERVIKRIVGEYNQKVARANEAKMMASAAAARKNNFEAAQAAVQTVQSTPEKKGVSVKEFWNYEVEDEDKIPDEYFVRILDEDLLKEHCEAGGKPEPVSGVRFFLDTKVTAGVGGGRRR